jgi:hypothetical protein
VLDIQNYCRLSTTTPACSIIPRAYINPAIYAVYPTYSSTINALIFSSSYASLSSPSSVLNTIDLRKNRRLIPIAISQYTAIVHSCPITMQLLRFNTSHNLSVIHLRLLGSASYMCDNTVSFSYTIASNRCWNSNTNYKYYTTNSPTSRSKYR